MFTMPTSFPMELVTGKTVCSTQGAARELERRLNVLGASSKLSTPVMPGFYVYLWAKAHKCTCRWQILVEPEADPQSDAPPF